MRRTICFSLPFSFQWISPMEMRKLHNTFWCMGKKILLPIAKLKGISEMTANSNSRDTYFCKFFVWKYPSTVRNAKIGNVNLPMHVIQSFPCTMVPHKWSNSMNTIAMMCNEKEVVSNFNLFSFKWYPTYQILIYFTVYFSIFFCLHQGLSDLLK